MKSLSLLLLVLGPILLFGQKKYGASFSFASGATIPTNPLQDEDKYNATYDPSFVSKANLSLRISYFKVGLEATYFITSYREDQYVRFENNGRGIGLSIPLELRLLSKHNYDISIYAGAGLSRLNTPEVTNFFVSEGRAGTGTRREVAKMENIYTTDIGARLYYSPIERLFVVTTVNYQSLLGAFNLPQFTMGIGFKL